MTQRLFARLAIWLGRLRQLAALHPGVLAVGARAHRDESQPR